MKKVYLSWEEFDNMTGKLAKKIIETERQFDGIYGIPRGGLPIAVYLSHKLDLPLLLYPSKRSLVVDDISDDGKTLNSFRDKFIATLYTTDWTITQPNCWIDKKKSKDDWIVFPWEGEDE